MTSANDPDAYLQEKEAARLISVSVRTLQAWRSRRTGPPFVRIGRAVRYQRRVLLTWVERQNGASAERRLEQEPGAESASALNHETSEIL